MYMGGGNQGSRAAGDGAAGRTQGGKVRKSSSKSTKKDKSALAQSQLGSSSLMSGQEDVSMEGVDEHGGVAVGPAPIYRQSKKREKMLMENRLGEGGVRGEGGMMYAGDGSANPLEYSDSTGLFRYTAAGVATDKPPPQKKAKSNHGKALKIHLGDAISNANAAAAAAAGGAMDLSYSTHQQLHEGFPVDYHPDGMVDPSVNMKPAPARRRKRLSDKGQEALVSPYVQGMAMDGAGNDETPQILILPYHSFTTY